MVFFFSSVKRALSRAWQRVKKMISRWVPKYFKSGSPDLSPDQQLELITRNLEENSIPDRTKLKQILQEKGEVRILWRTSWRYEPCLHYLAKIADFLRAGCEVTVFFVGLRRNSIQDNAQGWAQGYKQLLTAMFEGISVPLDKLIFLERSDHRHSPEYQRHYDRLSNSDLVVGGRARADDQLLAALDEEYLKMDAQFGGVEEKAAFQRAEASLTGLGYGKRVHLMMPVIPPLISADQGGMECRIRTLDTEEDVTEKLEAASCHAGDVEQNGVLALVQYVIWLLIAIAASIATSAITQIILPKK